MKILNLNIPPMCLAQLLDSRLRDTMSGDMLPGLLPRQARRQSNIFMLAYINRHLLMYAYAMECPTCKNYFTLKEFCFETNPFKVKCTECGFRLKYTNMKEIVKSIIIASVLILAAGYGLSLLIPAPVDNIFLIWVFVGCCVNGFYLVYKKALFEALPEPEEETEEGK